MLKQVSVAVVVLAAAGATAVVLTRDARAQKTPGAERIAVETVEITKGDLSTSSSLTGTLGYGAARVVKGAAAGVVTWLPKTGKVVKRGGVLYRVNDAPVPLFLGSPPLYRPLAAKDTVGRDVAMVNRNLKALGYATGVQPRTAGPLGKEVRKGEDVLTDSLLKAIKRWQRDTGLPEDGKLEVGDVAVLPAAVRVESVSAVPGDAAAGELMTVTPTKKVVTVPASPGAAGSLGEDDKVGLRMPDGTESTGRISAIATVAQPGDDPGAQQQVAVTVTMDDPEAAGRLDGGSIEVRVPGESRKGVLTVPVNALLALQEGGYALQLPDGRLVQAETGLFAQGMVEVSGAGLRAGLRVVTTS
ncbi:efflux RND transporter periplasmic adaptor subunit [Symbioplanes lichenis]|uniref:efflux RND transporter periplasmic adaptor subunit n=1 Tax=Symbioplanes lichenis TaxID=1629072 RepID=UPI0027389523|nr:efflux RND transporter periplasmic adaptor subunit [Actinoplanes lichenis]